MSPEHPVGPQPIVVHPELHGETDRVQVPDPIVPVEAPTAAALPVVVIREDVATPLPTPAPAATEAATRRAFSVDALRGFFLISMTLGFAVNYGGFPAWMYHRQMPPPTYEIVNIFGIGWRDLAYGAFLFTMAAALPLTIGKRIAKGETEVAIVLSAIRRYGLLLFFGILIGHSNTYFIGYTQTGRALAIAGFVIMAMVFTRRRPDWNEERFKWITRAGWVLAILFLAFSPLLYGKQFTPTRHDDIITGLAFASLAGSVLWYFTRDNLGARLGALAVAAALYLASRSPGWIQDWWYNSPAEWAFSPSMFSLLTVVIPGTIAGDVVRRWMSAAEPSGLAGWSRPRVLGLATLSVVLLPLVVAGMYTREVAFTTKLVLLLVATGVVLVGRPVTATERMLRSLFIWGSIWLVLGLFLEPSEGGIRKVPETLSYFFVIAGLTTCLLVAISAVLDGLGNSRGFRPLIDVGHNPLLAYVLYTMLLNALLDINPITRDILTHSAGQATLRMLLGTALVVVIVSLVTRKRIYWRT
jgi:predicted acyltransferase